MEKRRVRSKPLGQRSWIYRYPRTFQITGSILGLSIFFSKPIYDIFFAPRVEYNYDEPPTTFYYNPEENTSK